MNVLPLGLVDAGTTAVVSEIAGSPENVRRLKELGFFEGNELTVLNSGSPCMVRLGESKISFRDSDSASILVQVEIT